MISVMAADPSVRRAAPAHIDSMCSVFPANAPTPAATAISTPPPGRRAMASLRRAWGRTGVEARWCGTREVGCGRQLSHGRDIAIDNDVSATIVNYRRRIVRERTQPMRDSRRGGPRHRTEDEHGWHGPR